MPAASTLGEGETLGGRGRGKGEQLSRNRGPQLLLSYSPQLLLSYSLCGPGISWNLGMAFPKPSLNWVTSPESPAGL